MEKNENVVNMKEAADELRAKKDGAGSVTVYRFDIFKGVKDSAGKVMKVKSVGSAYVREGLKTYTVHLKTLLKDTFYLLPNTRETVNADFVILTREPAMISGRKYFWNSVGEGRILDGQNVGIMELAWDILGPELYMTLHPINVSEIPDAVRIASQAA